MPKVQLIDRAGNAGSFGLAVAFFSAFFIFLIAGGAAPNENASEVLSNSGAPTRCEGAAPFSNCVVEYKTSVAVTPYNQNVWVSLQLLRPTDTGTTRPALPSLDLRYSFQYWIDAVAVDKNGGRTKVVENATHLANMFCPRLQPAMTQASQSPCIFLANADTYLVRPITGAVFQQSFIKAAAYEITLRMKDPLSGFTDNGITNLDGNVTLVLQAYKVSEKFTTFQLGAKYFFFAVSLIMFSVYTWALYAGPGARDPDTKAQLPTTEHQRWCWWLSLGLVFANDPLFAAHLLQPSIEVAGFFAFSSFSFTVTLLFYWLVMFDRARIETFKTLEFTRSPKGCYKRCVAGLSRTASAMCFWMPKIILMLLFWVLTLAGYMYQMYQRVSDPAYNIFETINEQGDFMRFFDPLVALLISIYVIWIVFLVFIAMCGCKRVSLSGRFVMGVTMSAILFVIAAFIASENFGANRQSSLVFMLQYGALNSYMWFLQIAFIPAYPPTAEDCKPVDASADDFLSMGKGETAEAETQTDDLPAYSGAVAAPMGASHRGGAVLVPLGHGGQSGVPSRQQQQQQAQPMEAQAAGGEYFNPEGGDAMEKGQGWR